MFRLILLTLAGVFGVLMIYGTPEMAELRGAATAGAAPAVAMPAGVVRAALVPGESAGIDHADLVRRALANTRDGAVVEGMPGLSPSPEHSATPAAAPGAALEALYITASAVNLRGGAGTESPVVAALSRGDRVTPAGPTSGGWIEVTDAAGHRGFVSAKFLSPRDPG